MKRVWMAAPALAEVLALGTQAVAQQKTPPFNKKAIQGSYELHSGAGWGRAGGLTEGAGTQFDIGFEARHYLSKKRFWRRLNYDWALDYLRVGTTTYFDESLGSEARLRKELLMLNEALGFDLVQAPHLDLTLQYGGALVDNLTTFYLKNSAEAGLFSDYVDVCTFDAFQNRCGAHFSFLGNASVEARIYLHRRSPVYFGIMYTRYALGRSELVATLGAAF